ncbi:hypothetical protein GCM10008090_10360 [Arenicella chitinivorans]|uniref:DNA-directed DNA polymerase n=1 Tax=Arenicella chitinivorans TaxID=1329800 RepID=A0A918RNR2_9GAMM|nr:exonuclease domain-containing protein [Arenicella chitinivorans]GHA03278.1 hypothetical protein GCM10008090_10360 [Arenicella chitinivorans]
MPSISPAKLPEKYYLDHAQELFAYVRETCAHLLLPEHTQYLETFDALNQDAQCLLVRCLSRKPKYLKASSLAYPEIRNTAQAIHAAQQAGLLRRAKATDWQALHKQLTKPQLLKVLTTRGMTVNRSSSKADVIELVQTYVCPKSDVGPELYGEFVCCTQTSTIDYLLFLFYGSLKHRLQKFAMRDLGILRTRNNSNPASARFATRHDAVSTFRLQIWHRDFRQQPELRNAIADKVREHDVIGSQAKTAHDRLVLALGDAYVREDPAQAIALWRRSDDPQAIEKWVREWYRSGDRDTLRSTLEQLADTALPASTRVFIEDFVARKYHGKRTSVYTDMLREATHQVDLDEAYINDVEAGVIDAYQRRGIQATFSENKLWRALFGLAFWDLLLGDKQLTHTEFDHLPAALQAADFYRRNQGEIESILTTYDQPALALQPLIQRATKHYGQPTGLFRWRSDLIEKIAMCVKHSPPGAIAHVLRRMAQDYRNTHDGYPDLLVLEQDRLRFEEVKAPGDVLRPNQLVSINRLRRAGFQVDLTQVTWATDPNQTYAVVDIETTGGRRGGNAITEVAVVHVRGLEIISEWSSLVNPGRPIPRHITQLTGIDDAMVRDAPRFADIADTLRGQLNDAIFVAHNVGFDYGFIKAAYEDLGQSFRKPKFCTVKNTRQTFPGLKSYSLGALTSHFDIDLVGAHRALNDARATAHLLRLIQTERLQT